VLPEVWVIVQDVFPAASPVESERYDAVTLPWMS